MKNRPDPLRRTLQAGDPRAGLAEHEGTAEAALLQLLERRPACHRILAMILAGHTRAQAADRLGLSPHTVDWHLRRLYRDSGLTLVQIAAFIARKPAPKVGGVDPASLLPPPDSGDGADGVASQE